MDSMIQVNKRRYVDFALIIVLILILFPLLFFPSTNDLAVYIRGGQVLFGEGDLFVNFFDSKSPSFFAFYGIIGLFSGENIFYIRLAEFIIHLVTSYFLYLFLNGYFKRKVAWFSSLIYAISVITLNFPISYHLETLSGSLIILLLYLWMKHSSNDFTKNNFLYLVGTGLIIGILAGLKATFLIILPSFILLDLGYSKLKYRRLFVKYSLISAFILVAFLISHISLIGGDSFKGYLENWKYITFYSSVTNFNIEFFKEAIKSVSNFWGYLYSFPFSFAAFLCMYYFLRSTSVEFPKINITQSKIIAVNVILVLGLLISVIFERKFLIYHYARLYIPLSILAGIGLNFIYLEIKRRFSGKSFSGKLFYQVTIVILIVMFVALSPLSRMAMIWKIPIKYFSGKAEYYSYLDELGDETSTYMDKYLLTKYFREIPKDKKVLLASTGIYDLLFSLDNPIINTFPQRALFLSNFKNSKFREVFLKELNQTDYFIIQTNDRYLLQTGNSLTAYESILKDSLVFKILQESFSKKLKTENTILYQKN